MRRKVTQLLLKCKYLNTTSKRFLAAFILIIIFFALIDFLFSNDAFNGKLTNFLDALYFSVETITTLGFGDLYPSNPMGKILVIIESLLGIIVLGLFLNEIAHSQAVRDNEENTKELARNKYEDNKKSLERAVGIVSLRIERLLLYLAILSTPTNDRGLGADGKSKICNYTPKFDFHVLKDLYDPTMLMNDINKSAVECFFREYHKTREALIQMALNVNLSVWPNLESIVVPFLRESEQVDSSDIIMLQAINKKQISDFIRDWNDEFKYYPSNNINNFVNLYKLMELCHEFIQNFYSEIMAITKQSQEND